ncbi:hypothetical protein [Nannocystis bainbridge]|uniref:Uncharacterized protein n=1 Tax=Nannocystis bainbridge TaxID=2995303 RepID=A0ABT5DYM1_9BACT|nr:hypothetical protein [Nannocystis bainbridge]MDC0718695.1 hypothetical protein [Nannocystis bainbridge]
MLKTLIAAASALVLVTGCVVDTNKIGSDEESSTTASSTSTDTSTTDGSTTSDTEATISPTTTTTSTTDPETTSTTELSTTEGTTASTTGSGFGNCGWDANNKYYACGFIDADPDGDHPIECPDTLPTEGDDCDETSPINGVGCCLPDGSNYYCTDQGQIAIDTCGTLS